MMRHHVKKVFIAGGTGFLGYYAAKLFLERGISVDTIALPNEIHLGSWYPSEIGIQFGNLFEMSDASISSLLQGKDYDTFVYALGPDDRFVPDAPALAFFRDRLVAQCVRICHIAKRCGIRRLVVLNSYFAHFDRLLQGKLSKHHPYVLARVEQAAGVFQLGEDGVFDVMVLELPFIFGTMPNRVPLWREFFLSHFEKGTFVFFPGCHGGTTAIDVTGVAEFIFATAHNGVNGQSYLVGRINLTYVSLLQTMLEAKGDPRKVHCILPFLASIGGWMIDRKDHQKGKESGLDHAKLMTDILAKPFYADFDTVSRTLGFAELGLSGGADVLKSIQRTIQACYPTK